MSDKLSEEELLEWFDEILGVDEYVDGGRTVTQETWNDKDKQAYQQIVALIKEPEIAEVEAKEESKEGEQKDG